MKWTPCEVAKRPHNYQREDGWSVYLADEELVIWNLCQPDGKVAAGPSGLPPESIDRLTALADELIAKFRSDH